MRVYPAIKLDPSQDIPLFEQLADELENAIHMGRLEEGQMLPSSREFAQFLFISRGTVVRAYALLMKKGLVQGLKAKGLIVSKSPLPSRSSRLSELTTNTFDDSTSVEDSSNQQLSVEDVTKAAVPRELLPAKRWRELVMTHCSQLGKTYHTDALGAPDLRLAVSRFLNATRGLTCTADQISVFTNTDQALDTIARLLVKPGDTVIVEEPGYIGVANIFGASGANLVSNGIDGEGMTVDTLNSLSVSPKVLYATPISQDPTGVVMTEARQHALIQWAKANDCIIVEDSWDTDFWHTRQSEPCMQQKAPEQIIYLYSFWKLLFPLSNACFLVFPERLIPELRRLRALINRPPISIELMALTDLLDNGEVDALASKLQKSYRRRRQILIYSLSKAFGRTIKISPTSGGTHILVQFLLNNTKEKVLEEARECGFKILSLDDYYFDGRATDQFIFFFTNVSASLVEDQAQKLKSRLTEK
ncbi:MAG TPA: PLP-dependent aminotransferase family protein [Drouetiella sp.]